MTLFNIYMLEVDGNIQDNFNHHIPCCVLPYVFSRRQIDEYSPHVVKRQRLDSSSDPLIGPSSIRAPLRHPDQVLAGSSRSGFDLRYPSPHSRPQPQVPAVPESSNSLQIYAKDRVLYIQMTLNCTWYTSV